MRQKLRKQLAAFLKKTRGELTFVQFEKRMGISASTLHRIELCDQNVTLDMLEAITGRLKISISDIFGEQKRQPRQIHDFSPPATPPRTPYLPQTINDARLREVVGRHLHFHTISHREADEPLAHLA